MKVAFIQNIWHDYMGVMSISAYLRAKGHDTRIFIEGGERNLISSVKDYAPHLIGFPCLTGSHQWALSMADKLKRVFPVLNIFGGIHPTFFPEILKYPQVDMVCRGEGEEVMVEVLRRIKCGILPEGIEGVCFKKDSECIFSPPHPLLSELDKLPMPDRDLYYSYKLLANNPTKHFMASRGCIFNCSFCYNSPQKKLYNSAGYLRPRGIESVLEEISYVKERYPLKTVVFDDDVFIFDKERLSNFMDRYRSKIGLPFICNVRADLIDSEVVSLLKEGGCFRVCMGVESGNERIRHNVLNKRITDKMIIESARLIKDAGIKLLTNNMVGLPGETLEDALDTVRLNIKIKVDYPWCSILQPYPGTEIADYALRNGYIGEIDPDSFRPTFFESSILKQKDIREVVNIQKFFYLVVKFPWALPLVKKLVRFRSLSIFYNLIFLCTFAFRYMTANRYNLIDMFFIARDSLHLYIRRKIS